VTDVPYTLAKMGEIGARRFDVAIQPTYSRDLADLLLIAANADRKVAFDGDSFNLNWLSRIISNQFLTDVIGSERARNSR